MGDKRIEYYTGVIRGRLLDIERVAGDQDEKVKKLQAERDELKERLVAVVVNKRCENKWKTLCDWLRLDPEAPVSDVYDPETKPPHVITAEEMQDGRPYAVNMRGEWLIGHARVGMNRVLSSEEGCTAPLQNRDDLTIVELPLPEPTEPEVTAEPEFPTEPGSVILATEWRGQELDPPLFAVLRNGMWRSISGDGFPGDIGDTFSSEITGFRPARIVVEDGEA